MAVYKSKNGKYYCSFYYVDWTGTRKRKKKEGFTRLKDAQAWERNYLNKYANSASITFNNLYNIYIADKSARLRGTTIEIKQNMLKIHILPFFADKKINEVTPLDIRKWQNIIIKKGFSSSYTRTLNSQLSAVFNYGVRYFNLVKNPVRQAGTIGDKKAKNINFWTVEEFKKFMTYIDADSDFYVAYNLLFWAGIRKGELLALTFNDFDFKTNELHITKTLTVINKKRVINPPKTPKSNRVILLPQKIINLVKRYKEKSFIKNENTFLFEYSVSTLNTRLRRTCKAHGLKRIRIHDLRHSHASLLIELGYSPLLIKERLGHESIQTTLNTYSHLYPNKSVELVDDLNKLIK